MAEIESRMNSGFKSEPSMYLEYRFYFNPCKERMKDSIQTQSPFQKNIHMNGLLSWLDLTATERHVYVCGCECVCVLWVYRVVLSVYGCTSSPKSNHPPGGFSLACPPASGPSQRWSFFISVIASLPFAASAAKSPQLHYCGDSVCICTSVYMYMCVTVRESVPQETDGNSLWLRIPIEWNFPRLI